MKTIWKFPFEIGDRSGPLILSMPIGSQILSVQMQNDVPTIWAIVDELKDKENRLFMIFGTGQPFGAPGDMCEFYVGTIQTADGGFVWHIFEVKEIEETYTEEPE